MVCFILGWFKRYHTECQSLKPNSSPHKRMRSTPASKRTIGGYQVPVCMAPSALQFQVQRGAPISNGLAVGIGYRTVVEFRRIFKRRRHR